MKFSIYCFSFLIILFILIMFYFIRENKFRIKVRNDGFGFEY